MIYESNYRDNSLSEYQVEKGKQIIKKYQPLIDNQDLW